ncbi:Rab guanyl-nucleotide exchange factor [Mycena venus]|uniref:Rab guanyl-nucleotide exchange factor n=1 Tax=Mycena venus TaxID=2733690 RepID=A0A8H6WXZ7_9AGAR|nr:Rab guanyl-nucleotide exchange factor [Mycena venus]
MLNMFLGAAGPGRKQEGALVVISKRALPPCIYSSRGQLATLAELFLRVFWSILWDTHSISLSLYALQKRLLSSIALLAKRTTSQLLWARTVISNYSGNFPPMQILYLPAQTLMTCLLRSPYFMECETDTRRPGVAPTLIHTSGTGVLSDDADGMHSSPTIYSDLDIAQLETLSPDQPHRNVDLTLVDADSQGYVKTYIVLPSTIYGFASGPLVEAGLQNYRSQQIPRLVDVSLQRGQGGMVGKGKNYWPNVHIDDGGFADLYVHIFDLLAESSPPPDFAHGRAGFYFAENGEHTLYQVGEAIAQVLSGMGKGIPSPTTFTEKEVRLYFPNGTSLGSNSRCRAERGRKVGWRPAMKTQDMLHSIKAEVEASLSR